MGCCCGKKDKSQRTQTVESPPEPRAEKSPVRTKTEEGSVTEGAKKSSPPKSPVKERERDPRKRALLCGVSYEKGDRLEGPLNDVGLFKDLLIHNFKFREENIHVLTEEDQDPERIPTKANIQKSLKWLVDDCKSGDSLVLYFAGHGDQKQDEDGDEIDGMDEAICPCDFKENGMILDDEINSTIVAPLPKGVKLHAIVDACHSGTILDLEYVHDSKKKEWKHDIPKSTVKKTTRGGLAISISACGDDQDALSNEFTEKEKTGVMTKFLIDAIKADPKITYGHLLDKIQYDIEAIKQKGWLPMQKLFPCRKILQKTQLSSSETFDIYNKVLDF